MSRHSSHFFCWNSFILLHSFRFLLSSHCVHVTQSPSCDEERKQKAKNENDFSCHRKHFSEISRAVKNQFAYFKNKKHKKVGTLRGQFEAMIFQHENGNSGLSGAQHTHVYIVRSEW